ncbi:unnamed protein product [Brassica oleracea var. botrytis]|uniref:Uncharacterized protein n=1 Tax=Brassica oleracea TaxID=3712 RepID=A0A3P6DG29_BRAOL|nr:unnamed protein product [Brassica oleracea]
MTNNNSEEDSYAEKESDECRSNGALSNVLKLLQKAHTRFQQEEDSNDLRLLIHLEGKASSESSALHLESIPPLSENTVWFQFLGFCISSKAKIQVPLKSTDKEDKKQSLFVDLGVWSSPTNLMASLLC